jgi:hypothetical protein
MRCSTPAVRRYGPSSQASIVRIAAEAMPASLNAPSQCSAVAACRPAANASRAPSRSATMKKPPLLPASEARIVFQFRLADDPSARLPARRVTRPTASRPGRNTPDITEASDRLPSAWPQCVDRPVEVTPIITSAPTGHRDIDAGSPAGAPRRAAPTDGTGAIHTGGDVDGGSRSSAAAAGLALHAGRGLNRPVVAGASAKRRPPQPDRAQIRRD